mmetsp:Transcript_38906/g.111782  ORF Transcript_38906/g.111782 Transcript_38906/m.111782 type:complete len:206 (-) Transcript_38906:916-1533(-)
MLDNECEDVCGSEVRERCGKDRRKLTVRLGFRCERFNPDLSLARSSNVSTGFGLATSHNTGWSSWVAETCNRMPIMHSFGFSWSADSRKHWAGCSSLQPGLIKCSVRPRSKPLNVTSLNASLRETVSSGLIRGNNGWCGWSLTPNTFSSPQALRTRYSCVSTSKVASKTMWHMRFHHFCHLSPMTLSMSMEVTSCIDPVTSNWLS